MEGIAPQLKRFLRLMQSVLLIKFSMSLTSEQHDLSGEL